MRPNCKAFILIIFSLCISIRSFAQQNNDTLTQCKKVPFDTTAHPAFYDFIEQCDSVVFNRIVTDSVVRKGETLYASKALIYDSTINLDYLIPVKHLQKKEIDSLYYILYNHNHLAGELLCYSPRHGITFFKNGELVNYIEICFECNKIYSKGVFQVVSPWICELRLKILANAMGVKLD